MIKKTIHISLALILLMVTMGFSISKHYCGGNLVSVSLNHEAESCCDSNNCCQDKTEHYQLDDDFVFTSSNSDVIVQDIDILFPIFYLSLNEISETENITENVYSELPPPHKIQTVLSLIQTYLC